MRGPTATLQKILCDTAKLYNHAAKANMAAAKDDSSRKV